MWNFRPLLFMSQKPNVSIEFVNVARKLGVSLISYELGFIELCDQIGE